MGDRAHQLSVKGDRMEPKNVFNHILQDLTLDNAKHREKWPKKRCPLFILEVGYPSQ